MDIDLGCQTHEPKKKKKGNLKLKLGIAMSIFRRTCRTFSEC